MPPPRSATDNQLFGTVFCMSTDLFLIVLFFLFVVSGLDNEGQLIYTSKHIEKPFPAAWTTSYLVDGAGH